MTNLIPQLVAENLKEQVELGKIPSVKEAANSVGYKTVNLKAPNYQKALFDYMPFDWLARQQKKQNESWRLKTLTLACNNSLEDIESLCEEHDFILVEARQDVAGNKNWKVLVKIPDWEHRDKALDKIYKLQGLYAAEKHELVKPLEDLSDDELRKIINEGEDITLQQPQAPIIDSPAVENTFAQ